MACYPSLTCALLLAKLNVSFQEHDQEQYAHVMAFKSSAMQKRREEKRKGVGRKSNAEGTEKVTGKLITLYPAEGKRIDVMASSTETILSGVIRAAIEALEERQGA